MSKGSKFGELGTNWKGGRTTHKKGYILIKMREHPFCDKNGYVFEHRLVIEKHLGRPLLRTERVHHINGEVGDNRIENLLLFCNTSEHQKVHWPKGGNPIAWTRFNTKGGRV